MNKKYFIDELVEAYRKGFGMHVFLYVPGYKERELITTPNVNLWKKIKYYNAHYNDKLELKSNTEIKIVRFERCAC